MKKKSALNTASTVARNPARRPPSQATNMTVPKNKMNGLSCWITVPSNSFSSVAPATAATAIPYPQSPERRPPSAYQLAFTSSPVRGLFKKNVPS